MNKTKKQKEAKQKKGIIASTGKRKDKKKEVFIECKQKQCIYFQAEGCKKCPDCNAPAKMISEGCETCFACEYKPDKLRWAKEGHNDIISEGLKNTSENPDMFGIDNFEGELKQEVIRQMATSLIRGVAEGGANQDDVKQEIKENEKSEIKHKEVSYIG